MKLNHKLIMGFLAVVLMIWANGLIAVNSSRKVLQKAYTENTESIGKEIIDEIDRNMHGRIEIYQAYSKDKLLQETILKSNQYFEQLNDMQSYIDRKDHEWTALSKEGLSPFMQELIQNDLSKELIEKIKFFEEHYGYRMFSELIVTNKYGANVAQTGKTSDYRQDDEEWWKDSQRDGLYIKDIEYDESSNVYSTDIGIRINNEKGGFIGVIKIVLNIKDVIDIFNQKVKKGIYAEYEHTEIRLITKDGKLIYSNQEDEGFLEDVSYLLPTSEYLNRKDFHHITGGSNIVTNRKNENKDLLVMHAHSVGYGEYKGFKWILVVGHDMEEIFRPVTGLRNYILTISLLVTIITVLTGFLLSNRSMKSVKKLRDAAINIGKGNLNTRIDIDSNDEIGQLAKEFKHMTKALLESKEQLRSVIDTANDAIVTINSKREICSWNKEAEVMFGYSINYILGKPVTLIMPERLRKSHIDGIKRVLSMKETKVIGNSVELFGLKNDGREFPLELSLSTWKTGERTFFTGIIRDITERRQAEKLLEKLNKQNEMILNAAGEGIYGLDLKGNTTFVNPAAAKMIGWEQEELIGKSQHAILHHTKSDGNVYPKEECPIYAAFKDGAVHQLDHEVFWRKDGSSFPVEYISSPIVDEDDKLAGAVVTFRDITERKQNEKELKESKEKAEAANLAKSEFLANMSHEIRTPMNAIMGMTEITLDTDLNPEQRENLEIVTEASVSLLDLLDSILDLSKIEAERMELTESYFNLHGLMDNINKMNNSQSDKKGLELHSHISPDIPVNLRGDKMRLGQIILNLVGNAIKFTEKGMITINIKQGKSGNGGNEQDGRTVFLHFSVTDTGIGIPEEKLESVFDNFTQIDGSSTRKYGGTGLGLTISRKLVNMMGGEMWAESIDGEGSIFHFTARFGIDRKTKQKVSDSKDSFLKKKHPEERLRILVAEDNIVNQKVAVRMLEKHGHIVEVAHNGEEVLNILQKQRFDIVLMDVQMPKMDGIEATRIIRESKDKGFEPDIPIIAVTAHAFEEDKELCLKFGMNSCVTKPFKMEELFKEIEKVVQAEDISS